MNQHTNTIIPDFCLRVSDLISVPTGSALFPETLLSTPLSSPQQQATTVPLPLSTSVSPVPVVNPLGFGSTLDMNFDFGALNPSPPAAQSLLSWDSLPLNTSTLDFGAFLDNNTQLQQQYDTQAPTSTGPIANQDPSKWLSDDLFDLSVFGVTTLDNVAAVKSLDPTQFTFVSSSAPSSPVPSLEPLPAHAGTPPPLASPLVGSDATVIYSPTPSMALSTAAAAAAAAAAAVPHLSPSSLPASPFSLLSQQQHQHHHQQTTLDQLFLDATANVPISTSAAGSPAATVQLATTTVADDLDAILADLPDLEPTTPSAPAPNVVATAAAPPTAKRQRRRPPANELPPIVHVPTLSADTSAAPTTTLAIPTSTRKSKAKVASLPTLLEYPKDMIAHDAPILSNKRKRTNKRSAASSELDTQDEDEDEILPSDPSLVSDPAAAKRITNALSARRSRARKQAKLEFFESRVHELETANAQLAAQVAQLQAQLRAANLVPVQGAGSESALMS